MRPDQSHWFTGKSRQHHCPTDGFTRLAEYTDGRNLYVHCYTCKTTWDSSNVDELRWTVEKKGD